MISFHARMALLVSAFATFVVIAAPADARSATADLILTGGKIVTLVDSSPQVEALAIQGDRIQAIGNKQEILDQWGGPETRIIDLKGRLAIPGFIEGHGHFLGFGDSLMILDFAGAPSWSEIIRQVAEASEAAGPGVWIRGRGWHQDKWSVPPRSAVEGLPTHHELSVLTPNNPVILTHASGHAAFVNQRAMELAGIDADTLDPSGGEILRDGSGQATGFLRESAQAFARIAMGRSPDPIGSEDRRLRQVALAAEQCLQHGVTSFHDAGASFADIALFKKLASEGRLPLRLWVMLRASYPDLARRLEAVRMVGYADNRLTVQAIKLSLDGALGSRGAWLLEPYSDAPVSVGLNLMSLDSLRRTAALAAEKNFQLCVHAIGDRANREVLDIFEQTFLNHPARKDRRWRIEHAQHLHPDDVPRFGKLNVIASIQGVHCTSDGTWVPDRLGAWRARTGAYVWRDLARSGALIVNGTDVPVERINPIASFHASVTRRLSDGALFFPEQRMTRMEALRSYTVNPARAAFEDDIKGTLAPGMLADIVVLSKDILTCPDEGILEAQVDLTILGGQDVFRRMRSEGIE
jgi:predicted amidohydrolase YtcJ